MCFSLPIKWEKSFYILIRYLLSGNSSKITGHIFRIFDSDGNDFLDYKEFLMAIDVANRDTGLNV